MTKRRSLSTTQRVRIFEAHGGVCHLCEGKIQIGQPWDVSHETPLEMGGADDETNMKPAHRVCHRAHTAAVDVPQIARAKRRQAKHLGAVQKRPWSPYRKKLNGQVVRRDQ